MLILGRGVYDTVSGASKVFRGIKQVFYGVTTPCKVDCSTAGNVRKLAWGTIPLMPTITEGLPDVPDVPGPADNWLEERTYGRVQHGFDERISEPATAWLEGDRPDYIFTDPEGNEVGRLPSGVPWIPPQEYREDFDSWFDHLGGLP